MVKISSRIAGLAMLTFALGACENQFDAINSNPNNPEDAPASFVLTNAERQNTYRLFDIPANMDGGLLIIQHWAKVQYTNEDRYAFRTGSYQSIWDGFYGQGLQDFQYIIDQGKATNNPNYQAVGLVLRSYFFSVLTDLYGDIPYSQALSLKSGILQPKYDAQQDVYRGLLSDLKLAATLADANGPAVDGDIIYGGDMAQWKRFANSLRLRLAMRVSDADDALARTNVTEALAGGEVMMGNEDIAQFQFLGGSPNNSPVNENFKTRDDHRISRTIVNTMLRLNDPRIAVYANHPECGDSAAIYKGMPNGFNNANAAAYGAFCSTSKVGAAFRETGEAPGVLMTYAETMFLQAEAVKRGYIGGSAAQFYDAAITASLNQYGVGDQAAAYLAQPGVAFDDANWKMSIGNQKWLALFGQGVEAWSEWRRLDYPVLPLAKQPVAAAAGAIPVRFIYPANEQSVNQANYEAAVARQGADKLTTKLWWDRN